MYCTNALYRELYRAALESLDTDSIFQQRDDLISSGEKASLQFSQVVARASDKNLGREEQLLDHAVTILYAELGLVDTGIEDSGTSFMYADNPMHIHHQLHRAVPALTEGSLPQQAAQARAWIAANQIVLDQIKTFTLSCFKYRGGDFLIPPEYSKLQYAQERKMREATLL